MKEKCLFKVLAAGVAACQFCFAETAHVTLSDKPAAASTDPKHWWTKAAEYRDNEAKTLRDADVVWMGDSIIHYFENPGPKTELWKKYFGGPTNGAPYVGLNFAIEGDTTDNLLWRMKKSLDKLCPKAIILNIGTNNTGKRNEKTETTEDTLKGLGKILYEIGCCQPQAKVFVYALFPRGKGVTDPCMIRNERVNEGLRKLCDGNRVVWCDIRRKFLKPDGTVDQELLGDRLHPAPKGYEVWLADVLPRLEETMKEFNSDKNRQKAWWERYAWRAYTELKPNEQRRAVAEIAKLGLKPGGYVPGRVIPNIKMFDDYDRFPKAEGDIRFPTSLADLGVKDAKEVDVADFAGGWNPTDTTKCFQEAIDSDATTIHVRPAKGPWYVGQVNLKSNKRLVVHKGVKILMWQDPTREYRDGEPLFSIKNCENVLIEGEGTGVDESYVGCYGDYAERTRRMKYYGKCAFVLVESRNVVFRNLRIAETQNDAITFSGLGLPNVDTYLDNVVLDSNYRQAMSICNGDGVYCRRVTFSNTRGNAPTAGIDFEPPYEIAPNTGVYLFDCTFDNNGGGALLFSTSTYAPITLCAKRTRFKHCPAPTVDFLPRLGIYMKAGRKPYSKMVFEDCDFETKPDLPVFQLSCGPFFDFTVRNCRIACAAEKLSQTHDYVASPIQFALNRDFGKDGLKPEMTGVGTFENVVCTGYPMGTSPVSVSDELGLLDVRGALKGTITIDGTKHVLDDYVYVSPDRGVKRTAPVDVKKLLPPSDPKAHTRPPVLAWDGAWWMPPPKYTCLWFRDGKWNAQKPAKQPFQASERDGAPLAYQCDTDSDSFQKFFANDRDVCVHFEVPAGGKPCKVRINWGGAELRDPAGNVVERVKPGTYLGRHTFVVKPSTDKAEIWSLRFPKGSGIGVMRFYPPLNGVWAQSEGELPCVFKEHHVPAKMAKTLPFDPYWGDRFDIAYDVTKPLVDRSGLSAAQIAALDRAITARRELAAKKAWTKQFVKTRDEIAALAKNAKTDGQRRDAELASRNLPPLERAAKVEATASKENDNVRELAAWCQILAIEKNLSDEELSAKGLGLVKGLIEYDDVAALVQACRVPTPETRMAESVAGACRVTRIDPRGATSVVVRVDVPISGIDEIWTPDVQRPVQERKWWITKASAPQCDFPFISYFAASGRNAFSFGSASLEYDNELSSKINQEKGVFEVWLTVRTGGEPIRPFAVTVDRRSVDWTEALAAWRDGLPYAKGTYPEGAWKPVYCTWYAAHAAFDQDWVEEEAAVAAELGFKTFILDDGWSYDEKKRVNPAAISTWYRDIGRWDAFSKTKFPDFKAHRERMRKLGLKYIVWVAPYFIGTRTPLFREGRFAERGILPFEGNVLADVADKPFMDKVNDQLVRLLQTADLDGLKVDFLDYCKPSVTTPRATACRTYIAELMRRLRQVRPDGLYEFRQSYATPYTASFATQFRAGDVPFDWQANLLEIVQIRLAMGDRVPIHADPIYFSKDETTDNIDRHFLAAMAGVPMVSMDFGKMAVPMRNRIRDWLAFYTKRVEPFHREGHWSARYRNGSLAAVWSVRGDEALVLLTNPGLVPELETLLSGKRVLLLNLTHETVRLCGAEAGAAHYGER